MLTKHEMSDIMDALMIRHWGVFQIDDTLPRHFNVNNSILDAPFKGDATVIAIAFPYSNNETKPSQVIDFGRIEPFAWQFDYHKVVKEKLLNLKTMIENKIGKSFQNAEYHVDTSPYNDREVAFLAGLGRVGYHHLLINAHLGSYFFIGYILLNESLEIEKRVCEEALDLSLAHPFCASCKKCVAVCPTSVCGDSEADMKGCLSSLTQTTDWIPESLRGKFGSTIYGCSLCQKVCPLNRNLESSEDLPVVSDNWIDLFELLDMDQKAFYEFYGTMGFAWRKLWIYQRNALFVLANTGNKETLEKLKLRSHIEKSSKLSEYYRWSIETLTNRIFE